MSIDVYYVAVSTLYGVVFDVGTFVPRRCVAATICHDDARTTTFLLHLTAVHVVDIQVVEPNCFRYAEITDFDDYPCPPGVPLGTVIGDVEARKLPHRYVIEVYGSEGTSVCLQAEIGRAHV